MERIRMYQRAAQIDLFDESNIINMYEFFPISMCNSPQYTKWINNLSHAQEQRNKRHENWKWFMYKIRDHAPSIGYKVWRLFDVTRVNRFPFTLDEIKEKMKDNHLQVIK